MNFDIVNYANSQFNKSTNILTDKPKLVDNGVKYFLRGVLKNCHNYKQNNIAICLYLLKELFNNKSQ